VKQFSKGVPADSGAEQMDHVHAAAAHEGLLANAFIANHRANDRC
jgi:hypothetical protein